MSMRESTQQVVSTTPTRIYPDAAATGTRYMRFYLMPEVMSCLRQHQRDANKISYNGNPKITNRLDAIRHSLKDYAAWAKSRRAK